jgi:hypothetical protein
MHDESRDTPELFVLLVRLFKRNTPFEATRAKFPFESNDKSTKPGTILVQLTPKNEPL